MHTVIHMHMWMHMLVLARKKSFPRAEPRYSPRWLWQQPVSPSPPSLARIHRWQCGLSRDF